MDTIQLILGIALGVLSLVLIFLVMAQSGKDKGLGAIGGGSAETYFGKAKAASKEKILGRATAVLCVFLFALLIALVCISG